MTLTELAQPTPLAFHVTITTEGTSSVVALHGEADICTLPDVVGVLARVISEDDRPVIVDLSDTTFIDVGTVRAIGRASRFLAARDRTLAVRRPSRMAARLLTFFRLSDLIQPERATAALSAARPATAAERRPSCTSDLEPSC